jgi:hypothetical protein
MTKEGAGLRTGPKNSYHDKVFEEEINNLINITKEQYELYAASLLLPLSTADELLAHSEHSTKMPQNMAFMSFNQLATGIAR